MSYTSDRNIADALRRIRDRGSSAWCDGKGRGGGAVSRLFDRLAAVGYCTRAPHTITKKGREWLDKYDRNFPPKCVHCRKPKDKHSAPNLYCPLPRRERVAWHSEFSGSTSFFTPRP